MSAITNQGAATSSQLSLRVNTLQNAMTPLRETTIKLEAVARRFNESAIPLPDPQATAPMNPTLDLYAQLHDIALEIQEYTERMDAALSVL